MFRPHVLSSFLQRQQTYSTISSVSREGEELTVILALVHKERRASANQCIHFPQIETDSIKVIKIHYPDFAIKFSCKTLVERDS